MLKVAELNVTLATTVSLLTPPSKNLSFCDYNLTFSEDIRGELLALTTVPDGAWIVGYLTEEMTDKTFWSESSGTVDEEMIEKTSGFGCGFTTFAGRVVADFRRLTFD